jgi:hypothetical protein
MAKPDGAMAIGDDLYLFFAKVPSDECLITAHGGAFSGNVMFSVAGGVTLNFYAPHGFNLTDPGLALVYSRPEPTEVASGPGNCHDYELSKYQGRHNSAGETYGTIANAVGAESDRFLKARQKVQGAGNEKQRELAQGQLAMTHPFHVVTIRNRWASAAVRLSRVVSEVRAVVPMIRVFHCSFCRGHMHNPASPSARAGQI